MKLHFCRGPEGTHWLETGAGGVVNAASEGLEHWIGTALEPVSLAVGQKPRALAEDGKPGCRFGWIVDLVTEGGR